MPSLVHFFPFKEKVKSEINNNNSVQDIQEMEPISSSGTTMTKYPPHINSLMAY